MFGGVSVGTVAPHSASTPLATVHVPSEGRVASATHGAQVVGVVCAAAGDGDDVVCCPCWCLTAPGAGECDDGSPVALILWRVVGTWATHRYMFLFIRVSLSYSVCCTTSLLTEWTGNDLILSSMKRSNVIPHLISHSSSSLACEHLPLIGGESDSQISWVPDSLVIPCDSR